MHFQNTPYVEMKLVSCLQGEIWDVAVDLRKNSPTFLKWQGFILSDKNNKSIIVPEGCAHGFQTLENNTRIIYCHTNIYKKKYEKTVSPFDSRFNIKWPAKLTRISQKDKTA
jgi:dTDP-4-dehydrorhamnose 3,5-epimerase